MHRFPDDLLIQAFFKAGELNLSLHFIRMIEAEIQRRSLTHKIRYSS